MEASSASARAKRGCLWYVGIAVAGTFGLFLLAVAALIVDVHNGNGQPSIVVSADNQTYLEAETTNHGEGFLDGYDWLEVYYVRRGWIWNERARVYNIPHVSAFNVGFHRALDLNGRLQIEIKARSIKGDSTVVATFVPPTTFPDK